MIVNITGSFVISTVSCPVQFTIRLIYSKNYKLSGYLLGLIHTFKQISCVVQVDGLLLARADDLSRLSVPMTQHLELAALLMGASCQVSDLRNISSIAWQEER